MMEFLEQVSLWEHLNETKKPIVLYGMGDGADKILDELGRRGIAAAGVFASDEFCRGQRFRGFEVTTYAQAKERFGDMIVLVAFGTQLPEVMQRIKDIAAVQETYAPDVPVVGGGEAFDTAYVKKYAQEMQAAYRMLEDDLSRRTFMDMLHYKVSGKLDDLFDCESSAGEVYRDILRLSDQETYVDAGAYTGDTIAEFMQYAGGYRQIVAIEPDEKNFRRLEKSTEGLGNRMLCNCAAYDEDTYIRFDTRGGRNSAVGAQGKTICAQRIDSILGGQEVTYIKLDVEGQEAAALRGAKETIQKYRPKMLVSAYHRNDDMFRLPLLVREMRDDYKVYLRHFPYIPAWDTNYYFV
ncbi:MAG: FkbM family methyltransferase [Christensenella sp.]|uniref:FkbM family methyltransferase n=1 Tax=Christensenella sp. TaxID=1935934 RepID=UPI002B1F4FF7|nr:FkbM family methyltransferase [Christensenella sp.]MEA5003971.1 FkbM family methyltransferase [Christensenella sp.]